MELTNNEIYKLKEENPQLEILEYRDYNKVCDNPQEIPSRRIYFTGRALFVQIKSTQRNFTYKIRVNYYKSISKEHLVRLINTELKIANNKELTH